MKLSILILSVPSRLPSLPRLLHALHLQASGLPVEVLCLFDNKRRTVGEKRNDLLRISRGEYFAFVDDDDWVADDYVGSILKAIDDSKPDCVVFDALMTTNNRNHRLIRFGVHLQRRSNHARIAGKPTHICVWRRSLADGVWFPRKNLKEDEDWSDAMWHRVRHEHRINKTLYFYRFDTEKSETRHYAMGAKVDSLSQS